MWTVNAPTGTINSLRSTVYGHGLDLEIWQEKNSTHLRLREIHTHPCPGYTNLFSNFKG